MPHNLALGLTLLTLLSAANAQAPASYAPTTGACPADTQLLRLSGSVTVRKLQLPFLASY
jgi:hypothetical protein